MVDFPTLVGRMNTVSSTHVKFGNKIKLLRTDNNMSQEDLADKVGVDRSYMGFVERGEKNPTLLILNKIARAFGITLSELFKGL